MRKNRPRYLLDACSLIKDDYVRKYFGFVNSTEILNHDATDEEVLKAASKRRLTIVTKDARFTLQILINGKDVIFENQRHERIHIELKRKPRIEKNCHLRYSDFVTYYLRRSNKIIVP
jgi:hypothetical protein